MTNFVNLTNQVLTRLNEVTLDTAGDGFDTTRGVQALAKQAVNSAIRMILQDGQEWPFLKTTYVQQLTAGTTTYDFPADFSSVDWDTFYLKRHLTRENQPMNLGVISYEDYIKNYRSKDDVAPATGLSAPTRVFQTYDKQFGVTPVPDDSYEVEYVYWLFPSDLELFNDKSVIPGRFDHVIVDGAMMFMMMFRSNEQSAAMHQQKFEAGIKSMYRVLMDDEVALRSTVIRR